MGAQCSCQKEQQEEEKNTHVVVNGSSPQILINGNSEIDKLMYEGIGQSQRSAAVQSGSMKFESILPHEKTIGLTESQVILVKDKITSFKENSHYEGEMIDNLPEGKGREIYKNGDEYFGHFLKGKKNGFGVFYKKGEYKYEGKFKNNKINGYGRIYYDDGSFYEGEFQNGVFEGEGEYVDKNKIKRTGRWENGNFVG